MGRRRLARLAFAVVVAVPAGTLLAACGTGSVLDLGVGDCLRAADLSAAPPVEVAIDCAEPHDAEIFASTEMPDGPYPGIDALRAAADDYCLPRFEEFVGVSYLDSVLDAYPLLPSEDTWNSAGDREILCVLVAPEDVTGTLRDAAR